MMRNTMGRGSIFALLLAMAAIQGCSVGVLGGYGQGGQDTSGRSYQESYADNQISSSVIRALVRDQRINSEQINVYTSDGIVSLTGSVRNGNSVWLAEQIARGVSGVKGVLNHLKVQ